jgi:hypothetical protein
MDVPLTLRIQSRHISRKIREIKNLKKECTRFLTYYGNDPKLLNFACTPIPLELIERKTKRVNDEERQILTFKICLDNSAMEIMEKLSNLEGHKGRFERNIYSVYNSNDLWKIMQLSTNGTTFDAMIHKQSHTNRIRLVPLDKKIKSIIKLSEISVKHEVESIDCESFRYEIKQFLNEK